MFSDFIHLFEDDAWLLLINWTVALFAFFLAIKTNKLNSTLLSLSIMIFFSTIMTWYAPHLLKLSYELQGESVHVFRAAWYLGFALIDLFIIGLVLYTHYKYGLRKVFCAYAVLCAYSLKMQLHIFRYLERELFDTSYLKVIYSSGIPLINKVFSSIILAMVGMLLLAYITEKIRVAFGFKTFKKGVSWYI